MGVGVEDGIDLGDLLSQCLLAEIGAAVDNDGALGGLNVYRRAGTDEFWVAGGAYGAVAPDDWHACGCARAEECEGKFGFQSAATLT